MRCVAPQAHTLAILCLASRIKGWGKDVIVKLQRLAEKVSLVALDILLQFTKC